MRTLVTILISICTVSLNFAQNASLKDNPVTLTGITVKPVNLTYMRAVSDERFPDFVMNLERKAARYDVTGSEVFDGGFEAYEVTFSHENGSIIATYDQDGKILETIERFHNITLPAEVRNRIYSENPGWTIHKDMYLVSYYYDKGARKVCKLQLRKDGDRKNVKIEI